MEQIFWCVEYIASFLEIFLCIYFCSIFIQQDKEGNVKKRAIILSLIEAGIIILLNRVELFSYFTTCIAIILFSLVQWIYYKKRYLLCITLALVYIVFTLLIDFTVVYFM